MLKKEKRKEKEKVVSENGDVIGADTPISNSDMGIDNEKEKSAQEQEEENLDLVMETDDWAASPASPLSLDEEAESQDSANLWD